MSKVKFTIISLFSDALDPYLNSSMMWKAKEKGIAEFDFVDLREFGLGAHKSVDDTPYGGGDGMLLMCEPVFNAIESVKKHSPNAKVILPTPAGQTWHQGIVRNFVERINHGEEDHYIILCPHYEGYDERILTIVDYKISLGHFVLTGGELPALIVIDSIVRLLPGVLGGENSAIIESFSEENTIEYPQYTKPADFRGMQVPEVLLSGHHAKIAEWRKAHSRPVDQGNL
ncbi:MAG: tRNA (guanosine(37)-N1)-methyltransferase TrmD [Candidatus Nanosynbacter sp.]|jgi:tRNA (guanine-N(1)-)-methyltransferase|nr:tRNA (guanosine(37)-N1)-methyltransferase TrmD [Candidatus Nanosynbacter sp.]